MGYGERGDLGGGRVTGRLMCCVDVNVCIYRSVFVHLMYSHHQESSYIAILSINLFVRVLKYCYDA